jgi:hypothetical protein
MAGATTAQIMDVTGHRDPKSLRRYTRRELLHDVAAQGSSDRSRAGISDAHPFGQRQNRGEP